MVIVQSYLILNDKILKKKISYSLYIINFFDPSSPITDV